MPNPTIVPKVMKLYAPFCPDGKLFQKGEEWPGGAWSPNPHGKDAEVGERLDAALIALARAQVEIERLQNVITGKDHSLAQLGKERDEAVAEAKSLKQRTLDAEKARKAAESVAAEVTKERDLARSDAESLRRRQAA